MIQLNTKHLQHEPEGSPWVPKRDCCTCRVPVLISGHNYMWGWGETWCKKCDRHYAWAVRYARTHNNRPRSQMWKGRNQ